MSESQIDILIHNNVVARCDALRIEVVELYKERDRLQSECETLRHDARVMAEIIVAEHNPPLCECGCEDGTPICQCEACNTARKYVGTECVK